MPTYGPIILDNGVFNIRKQVRIESYALYYIDVIRYIIIISKEVQVFRVLPQEREEDGFTVDSIRIINEPLVYHFLGNAGRQGMVNVT